MTRNTSRWANYLRWGLVMIALIDMGPAFAAGGRIQLRKIGVVPRGLRSCVMDGALYLYSPDERSLVRYRVSPAGALGPGRKIAELPCRLARMDCGPGRIVAWCGGDGKGEEGLEWRAATGEVREFRWPWKEVLDIGVLPDAVLILTKERLMHWRIGQKPETAVVLYRAMREDEQLLGMVVDSRARRVAILVADPHGPVAEDEGTVTCVMALELDGERAKFVAQYGVVGSLAVLARGVLWGRNERTCRRTAGPVSPRLLPPGLIAQDWKTGKLLALRETDSEKVARIQSDGQLVLALSRPKDAKGAHSKDVYDVCEMVLEGGGGKGSGTAAGNRLRGTMLQTKQRTFREEAP